MDCAKEILKKVEELPESSPNGDEEIDDNAIMIAVDRFEQKLKKYHEIEIELGKLMTALKNATIKISNEFDKNKKKIHDVEQQQSHYASLFVKGRKKDTAPLAINGEKKNWGDVMEEEEKSSEGKTFAQIVSGNKVEKLQVSAPVQPKYTYLDFGNVELKCCIDTTSAPVAGMVYYNEGLPIINIPLDIKKNGQEKRINLEIVLVEYADLKNTSGNIKMVDCKWGDKCERVKNNQTCSFYHHGRDVKKSFNSNRLELYFKESKSLDFYQIDSMMSSVIGMIITKYISIV